MLRTPKPKLHIFYDIINERTGQPIIAINREAALAKRERSLRKAKIEYKQS